MTNFKKILLAATAMSMVAGAAYADDNKALIDQQGESNRASIVQSGKGNRVGGSNDSILLRSSSELRALQDKTGTGTGNLLVIEQAGDNNKIGSSSVDGYASRGLVQAGSQWSDATITQASDGNTVGSVKQVTENGVRPTTSSLNKLTITQGTTAGTGDNNMVGSVSQIQRSGKAGNVATIAQTGEGNTLSSVSQTGTWGNGDAVWRNSVNATFSGNGNGNGALTGAAAIGVNSSSISQSGTRNAANLEISGNSNQFGIAQSGQANSVGTIAIYGNSNEFAAKQASVLTRDGSAGNAVQVGAIYGSFNKVGIDQNGLNTASIDILGADSNGNNVSVSQLVASTATIKIGTVGGASENNVKLSQDGVNTSNVIVKAGNSNMLDISQTGTAGAGNSANVTITGSFNNNGGSLTGFALDASSGLTAGAIKQIGTNNALDINVGSTINSDRNLFAFNQNGSGNSIVGSINGSYNQATVTQIGASNTANFTQSGSFNNIGIKQ